MTAGTARAGRSILLIVAAGLLTGILTLAGQAVLDAHWNRLANSGAIWLTVAFAVGAMVPTDRWAAVAGVATLVLAVVGYYAAAAVSGAGVSTSSVAIWVGTAIVGGPVFGVAGRWWRGDIPSRRPVAVALLGGVFVAEGVNTLLVIPDLATTGWVEIVGGVAITLVLGRSTRERVVGLALLVPISAVGVLAYRLIDRLFLGS